MRLIEWGLWSVPALLVLAWLLGVRLANGRSLTVLAFGLALLGGVLFWMGDRRGFTGSYTPARMQDGQVTPAQGGR